MNGWIKISRRICDWEWFGNPLMVKAWIWLLTHARSKDTTWQGMPIQRGQLITSYPSLAESIGASKKQTRLILERLKRTGEVVLKSNNRFTIVTICKYDTYQVNPMDDFEEEGQAEGQTKGRQRADKGQTEGQGIKNKEDTLSPIKKDNPPKGDISKESSPYGVKHFLADVESLGVNHQTALDWIACRKERHCPFTITAFQKTVKELGKIPDKTPQELIQFAAEKGWGGFEAEYYITAIARKQNGTQRNNSSSQEILGNGIYESTI